jgi:hypothetical protein
MAFSRREQTVAARSEGVLKCGFCKDPIPATDGERSGGVCRLCAAEVEEFGWRTLYDREQNIGQIPPNLRVAYKL